MIDLSKIPARPKEGLINVLVEIPGRSHNKFEFDKDLGIFTLDRVLYAAVYYPGDYGFVPNTLADDGDPLDGLVLMDEPTFTGCLIAARPIGVLGMIDSGEGDEKILCVPVKDPRYAGVKDLSDIAQHRLDEIAEFFATYKRLEKKVTEITGWQGVEVAQQLVDKAIAAYTP
ncbi:inorganic pyrophosphatase [Gloeobacter violaceus PCC 7421]|uniref:Inorganic pyrophosphatase n=1 Tax=Gloeobacter violaceus (strain ATCC 29082 / PCC 7421) TaxID=251221 RepID=Q7NDK8_GLOVI|nr:inorganic diphosphatase [Gloeobacter violaceus]BAC92168.1 inorganic pyrophosphatase [Gloeobacter violaceus PCC 7421]